MHAEPVESLMKPKDQEALWDMGAVSMLKNLIHSKHKMIAMGSAAALRNLKANRPAKYKDANIMSPWFKSAFFMSGNKRP